ncbi:mitochondrial protein Pet127-domain-containing protein [Chaetomium fimeti]|uniref:Mitochondrial protein Pet127-domain-containing protein n=1 Tax=Chaetomium fimeti TaxID=1854472 RepID=A0AAE0HP25_9PEZI|nr:mitochondrial protein Pet127-domain-containing protein [Chaetomium fimeti]
MLRLARQGRSALRNHFICISCRALLTTGATRLPSAVAKLCAARHFSSSALLSTDQPSQPPQISETTEKQAEKDPEKHDNKKPEKQDRKDSEKRGKKRPEKHDKKDFEKQDKKKVDKRDKRKAEKQAKEEKDFEKSKPSKSTKSSTPTKRAPSASALSSSSPTIRHKLWRETLKVLKDIKADQRPPSQTTEHAPATEPGAQQPAPAADSGSPNKPKGAKGPPARDANLLDGALAMLKQVLREELRDDAQLTQQTVERVLDENPPTAAPKEKKITGKTLAEALGAVKPAGDNPAEQSTAPTENSSGKAPKKTSKSSKLAPLRASKNTGSKGPLDFIVNRIDANKIDLTPIEKEQPPVPSLAYGLDRVLFNPGVYHIQDPRSRVFNFDPYLERIMPVKEFDYDAIKQYITSSKDTTLIQTAAEHNKKYTGSTSSMTSTLAHFHYLLSAWRPINPGMMTKDFEVDSHRFTRILRAPAATFLHWKDGTYAIDADKEFDSANVLSMLGKSMEKFLTLPKEEFEKYRRSNSDQLTEEERNGPESYHYTTLGDFMMRSQLDAYDPRLPGTGMFDLKTRAVISIRMDARDFHKGMGYEIRSRFGQWESFEREYYDMIRSAFLKYSLQVRMGRMDGIFVAYHNTERIFGFQYIPLQEMDLSLHGQEDVTLGDREFKLSLYLLNKVLDKAAAKYPGRSLRLHFETRGEETPFMYIFAKPVTPAEIEQIQGATQAKIEEFERQIMGVVREARALEDEEGGEEGVDEADELDIDEAEGEQISSSGAWEDVMLRVEDELEDEEHGLTFVREAIENALRESGLLRSAAPDETQRYVDSFLDALTGNGRRSAPEGQETSELAESSEAEASVDAESAAESGAETDATSAGTSEAAEVTQESSEDSKEGGRAPATEDSSADEPTLKDLIVKLAILMRARQARARQARAISGEKWSSPIEDEGIIDEDASEVELKLRKIEKILSELEPTGQPQDGDKIEEGLGNGVEPTESAEPGEPTETTETVETVEPTESVETTETAEPVEPVEPTELTETEDATPSEDSATPPTEAAVETEGTSATETEQSENATPSEEGEAEQEGEASGTKHYHDEAEGGELYGLILTIRNRVNCEYVARPEKMNRGHRWQVEYAIEEVKPERAQNLYRMVLNRRKNLLYPEDADGGDARDDGDRWYSMFQGNLNRYSTGGRKFRRREDRRQRGQPVHVYGADGPLSYEEVFSHTKDKAEENDGDEDVDEDEDGDGKRAPFRKGGKKKW